MLLFLKLGETSSENIMKRTDFDDDVLIHYSAAFLPGISLMSCNLSGYCLLVIGSDFHQVLFLRLK